MGRNYKPYNHPNLDSKGYQRNLDEQHRIVLEARARLFRKAPLPVVPFPRFGIRPQAVEATVKRACPWCSLVECTCNFPYPTKGSYSKAQMEEDLIGLDFMSATISHAVVKKWISGFEAKIAYDKLDYMRRKCRMRLAFLATTIGNRQQEKLINKLRESKTPIPIDKFGRRQATSPKEG